MPTSIEFDAQNSASTKINYSVPLPGQTSGKRIIKLDLDLSKENFRDAAIQQGVSYKTAAGISIINGTVNVDEQKATSFLHSKLKKIGYNSASINHALLQLPDLLNTPPNVIAKRIGTRILSDNLDDDLIKTGDDIIIIKDPVLGDPTGLVETFAANAQKGVIVVPYKDSGGGGAVEEVPDEVDSQDPDPQLFIVEVYGISSFLGDYGMGKTVRTFTLLPGESTTIKLKTWQSTKESIKASSSEIDSSTEDTKKRFSDSLKKETTDKSTDSQTEKWKVEAEASASWGWGSASVKGSAEGEYHSGREQFAKSASEAVKEEAKETSSKREMSISSSTEKTTDSGEESVIERVISNVNMRRVLNFVFKELNQEYTTKMHLKEIYIAFANGQNDVWRQVPISGLRGLLDEVLTDQTDKELIAKRILKIAGIVFNDQEVPVRVVESVTYDRTNDSIAINPVTLDQDGEYNPPTENEYYRFKKGPLEQDGSIHPVQGVLLSSQKIVMRTDSVIVEALLGQADALDNYSMEIQEAAARKETLANDREELIQSTINAIADPETRAKAAAALYNNNSNE